MRRHGGRTAGFASAATIVCGVLVGCGRNEAAPPLAIGQPMSIGDYSLTIERVQPAPRPGPPISSFREQPGREGIMVFTKWAGLDELEPLSRIAFAQGYLEDRLAIVDSTGERQEPTAAMQSALLFMNDPGDNWRDWIVLFHVPEESGGWILEVDNPEPAEGQPDRFEVALGG